MTVAKFVIFTILPLLATKCCAQWTWLNFWEEELSHSQEVLLKKLDCDTVMIFSYSFNIDSAKTLVRKERRIFDERGCKTAVELLSPDNREIHVTRFECDSLGRRSNSQDNAFTTKYLYDQRGRGIARYLSEIRGEKVISWDTIRHTFKGNRLVQTVIQGSQTRAIVRYHSLGTGRLVQNVNVQSGNLGQGDRHWRRVHQFDKNGNLVSIRSRRIVYYRMEYNSFMQLVKRSEFSPSGLVLRQQSLEYYPNGLIRSETVTSANKEAIDATSMQSDYEYR